MPSSHHAVLLVAASLAAPTASTVADPLVSPAMIVVDRSLPAAQAEAQILAARRYATFWHTGEPRYAEEALGAGFIDRTLPPGRPQGRQGPLVASRAFRGAVPDLTCAVEQLLVAGDRVTVLLRFRGHFTGTFQGRTGQGEAVDFAAFDTYRIEDGRIAENWHLEDNLTLLRQLAVVASN